MISFVSTRGRAGRRSFEEVLLAGLAEDGGLFVPEVWPKLDFAKLRGLNYAQTTTAVLQPFVQDCFDTDELAEMCEQSYAEFQHPAVAPLRQFSHDLWLLELFHGPTLAFKDFALQLLGRMFEKVLKRRNENMTIIGATSGDTGSAAIHACAGRANINICILHPNNRVSEVQRRQMTTHDAKNLLNLAVEGTFDDCQDRVKDMFNDAKFRRDMRLGAINSINLVRLIAQVAYYVYAALRLNNKDRAVSFSVPTGNFGDVYAGYVAHCMGLPIKKLVVATNRNDILARFFETGCYRSEAVVATMSPSMDIQIASNFERLLFDLLERDGSAVADKMQAFKSLGEFTVEPRSMSKIADLFAADRVDETQTLKIVKDWHNDMGYVCDPHTAVGIGAGRSCVPAQEPLIVLATAHPAKFPVAVERAIGRAVELPSRCAGLFERPEHFDVVSNDLKLIQNRIQENFL